MSAEHDLVESYRMLTEALVGAVADLAPRGKRVAFLLEEVAAKGLHEGTDEAVGDFCRRDGPEARLMRLVAAGHRKRLLERANAPD